VLEQEEAPVKKDEALEDDSEQEAREIASAVLGEPEAEEGPGPARAETPEQTGEGEDSVEAPDEGEHARPTEPTGETEPADPTEGQAEAAAELEVAGEPETVSDPGPTGAGSVAEVDAAAEEVVAEEESAPAEQAVEAEEGGQAGEATAAEEQGAEEEATAEEEAAAEEPARAAEEEAAAEEAAAEDPAEEEAAEEEAAAERAREARRRAAAEAEADGMRWYVIHTYSGYEKKVKQSLEERVRTAGLDDDVAELLIPTEDIVEMKAGKKVVTAKKFFPGYLLVRMRMSDQLWHVVKNTPRVTGFVGSGRQPIPLPQHEVDKIVNRMEESVEAPKPKFQFRKGESVRIIDGPFSNFTGKVDEVDNRRNTLKVMVSIFGRNTPVELDFFQVEKV